MSVVLKGKGRCQLLVVERGEANTSEWMPIVLSGCYSY